MPADQPIRPLPPDLTRYVERPEPTPEDRFRAWCAEQAPSPLRRRTFHRAPQGRLRVWISISLSVGMLGAVWSALVLNVVR